ncbi:ANTAR domain-containing protein [Streptomyces sp. MAR25Y5]|uniref:ANTAR domain-containing protein n=1 Tax=Streptomyces sp. MAR25Y5 TaxID=2962028 RepID=UPI003F8FF779
MEEPDTPKAPEHGCGRPGSGTPDPEVTMPTDGEADRILQLEEEVQQLKEAVVSHAVVDQAIGVVVVLGRLSPDQGWTVLREISQHTNVKLRDVAGTIVASGRTGVLPQGIRTELRKALDRLGAPGCPDAAGPAATARPAGPFRARDAVTGP